MNVFGNVFIQQSRNMPSRNTAKKHEEFHLKHNVLNIFQEIVVLRWYLAFFREKVTIFL